MLAVQGFYDGEVVVPKEKIPFNGAMDVIITFPDIGDGESTVAEKLDALQQLVGVAAGNTMTLDDAKTARLSRQ